MKRLTIDVEGKRHKCAPPFPTADHAVVEGFDACPFCKAPGPFKIAGSGRRIESHDTYAADGYALCCKRRVGTIRAVMATLFGLEEDERIAAGAWRIY